MSGFRSMQRSDRPQRFQRRLARASLFAGAFALASVALNCAYGAGQLHVWPSTAWQAAR